MSAELFDRRQRACETFADSCHVPYANADTIDEVHAAIDEAIETATRVRLDTTILKIAWAAYEARSAPLEGPGDPDLYDMLYAAFEAAGFEVES